MVALVEGVRGSGQAQRQVRARKGHAGQHVAFGLFFGAQAGPLDLVAHLALIELADAGAASAVAAGTGPVDATLFGREQQGLVGPGIKLLVAGFDFGGKEGWGFAWAHKQVVGR